MSKKIKPICQNCGSEEISRNTTNEYWDGDKQSWETDNDTDFRCSHCGDDADIRWVSQDFASHYDCQDCGGDYGESSGFFGVVCGLCKRGTVAFTNLPDEDIITGIDPEKDWSVYSNSRMYGKNLTYSEAVNLQQQVVKNDQYAEARFTPEGN